MTSTDYQNDRRHVSSFGDLIRRTRRRTLERALAEALCCRMLTANFVEAAVVLESRAGTAGGYELNLLLKKTPIELVAVTTGHAQAARRT